MSELRFSDLKELPGVQFMDCGDLLAQNPHLRRFRIDSRQIEGNDVFVAIVGEKHDAHEFVPAVALSGALCAIVQRPVQCSQTFPQVLVPDTLKALQQLAALNRRKFEGPVIGLTGSNGKTTTKEMMAHILSARKQVLKTSGNLNNHIGCPLTLLQLKNHFDVAIIEMGTNHPGEIETLAGIVKPDAALITNIGPAHLEFFKSLEGVAREKLSLFQAMEPGGVVFVNGQDPYLKSFRRDDLKKVTFGLDGPWDVRGRIIDVNEQGNYRFELNEKTVIQLQVPGKHNVLNALAAGAVALFYGLSETEIAERLQNFSAFDKRMQIQQKDGLRIINDAYNANPQSMFMAFETLQKMDQGSDLFLILGDMLELGEQSDWWHRQVLERAAQLNPRAILLMGESMRAAANALNLEHVQHFESHEALARELKKQLGARALIFIKGSRGLEMEKVLNFI